MKQLTLLIPCYNSAAFIEKSFSTLEKFIETRPYISLVFIDDSSKDETLSILSDLQKKSAVSDRIKILKNEVNLGKGGAIKRGILAAESELIAFTDPDLAYDLKNIDTFYESIVPSQLLVANRVHPESLYLISPAFFRYIHTRHLSSRILNKLVSIFLIKGIEDCQAGLKMFYAEDIKPLLSLSCKNRFGFDMELLCMAKINGIQIVQMPVLFYYTHETSTVSFLSDSLKLFADLFHISFRKVIGKYKRQKSYL